MKTWARGCDKDLKKNFGRGKVYASMALGPQIDAELTVKSGPAHNESDTIVLDKSEESANASTTQLV